MHRNHFRWVWQSPRVQCCVAIWFCSAIWFRLARLYLQEHRTQYRCRSGWLQSLSPCHMCRHFHTVDRFSVPALYYCPRCWQRWQPRVGRIIKFMGKSGYAFLNQALATQSKLKPEQMMPIQPSLTPTYSHPIELESSMSVLEDGMEVLLLQWLLACTYVTKRILNYCRSLRNRWEVKTEYTNMCLNGRLKLNTPICV